MSPTRWPRRRRPRATAAPPPLTGTASRTASPSAPPVPRLVPARRRDAAAAAGVILAVEAALLLFLVWLLERWPPEAVPQRVIYASIGVGTIFAIILFALSLLAYVVPRLLGLLRGDVQPGKA